jgi:hypothetical protein
MVREQLKEPAPAPSPGESSYQSIRDFHGKDSQRVKHYRLLIPNIKKIIAGFFFSSAFQRNLNIAKDG